MLPELMAMGGERGAGGLIRSRPQDVAPVPCEAAALDLDTPGDVTRLP
jgi:hypothetical protein